MESIGEFERINVAAENEYKKTVTFNLKENETPKTNNSSIAPPRRKMKQPQPLSVATRHRKRKDRTFDSTNGIEKIKRIPNSTNHKIRPVRNDQIKHIPTTTEQAQKINMCSNVSINCDLTHSNGNKAKRDKEGNEKIKQSRLR